MATNVYQLAAVILAVSSTATADQPHFSYTGAQGPANWATLSPAYATCASGKSQSPIDITAVHHAELPALEIDYSSHAVRFANNGHAVQADYAAGSTLAAAYHEDAPYHAHVSYASGSTLDHLGASFELKQFHFHAPSEHRLNGRAMPVEIHFVHVDASGHLAVIGVFVEEGPAHPTIARLWEKLPATEGEANPLDHAISANDLLPAERDYDFYQGSLTTPPCTEGVRWLVMRHPITMSAAQIGALKSAIGFDNNRPVQALNSRVVFD